MRSEATWQWFDPQLKIEFRLSPAGLDFQPVGAVSEWGWVPVPAHLRYRALKNKPRHTHPDIGPGPGPEEFSP